MNHRKKQRLVSKAGIEPSHRDTAKAAPQAERSNRALITPIDNLQRFPAKMCVVLLRLI